MGRARAREWELLPQSENRGGARDGVADHEIESDAGHYRPWPAELMSSR